VTGQVAFERLADRAFLKMRSWQAKGGPLVSVGVIESDEASGNFEPTGSENTVSDPDFDAP
jgi:hypothetical protein